MSGRLIAVVGPSGVGKDTVMQALAASEPRLGLVQRVITRPSEAGGEVFDGVSTDAFTAIEAAGGFALNWRAHGLHYGIPTRVETDLATGRDMLVNLSRSVLEQARTRFPSLVIIALTAKSEVLAARLAQRGRESATEIARRLSRTGAEVPDGAITIDNSGDLETTLRAARDALYPVRA